MGSDPSNRVRDVSRPIMRIAPLFPVALGMVFGVIVDEACRPPWWGYIAGMTVSSVLLTRRGMRDSAGPVLLVLVALCCGGLLHASVARYTPGDSIERFASPTGPIVRVRGVVVSAPRLIRDTESAFSRWSYRTDRSSFALQVESIEGKAGLTRASGRVHVSVREAVLDLREGERVGLLGRLFPLSPPRNPGAFDWSSFQRRQGVLALLVANHRESIRRVGSTGGAPERGLVARWRTLVRGLLVSDLTASTGPESSLLEAMVIGHRSRVDRRLNEAFIEAGCVHFLAVSGVHVGIVMLIARLACGVVSLVRVFLGGPKLRRSTCTWVMLTTVIAYMLVAEPRPPILRAGIIAVVYCVARLLGRERAPLNWLSFAVISLALIDPRMVFGVGYQLSTVAVLGVGYLSPALKGAARDARGFYDRVIRGRRFAGEDRERARQLTASASTPVRLVSSMWHWLVNSVTGGLAVAVGAWLVTLPIVALYFHRVHPWGALASMLLLPLVMVVMALGIAKLLGSAVGPELGAWAARPLEQVDAWLVRLVDWLGGWPGTSVEVMAPPWWLIATYYVFLFSLVMRWPCVTLFAPADDVPVDPAEGRASTPRHVPGWAPVAGLLVFAGASAVWFRPAAPPHAMRLSVLSVGAGSAQVIELPEGQTILVDVGNMANSEVGRHVVAPFLQKRGIRKIDRVYLSHANIDHLNGLPGLLEHVPTGPLFVHALFERHAHSRSPARHLLKLLEEADHRVEVLDESVTGWHYGGADFELLWPVDVGDRPLRTNDTSMVLRISHAGRSIMLTGDIEERALRALLQRGDLQADVLVLPHHGDVEPGTRAFIEAVNAELLIRSSHERMAATYNGLPNIIGDRRLYNTADDGAVFVEIERGAVTVFPFVTRPR